MSDLLALVEELAHPWEDVLSPQETGRDEYVTITHDPLLDMLHDAKVSSPGRTEGGRSEASSRNLLNFAAYQLWEHIDGGARAWVNELSKKRAERDLKDAWRAQMSEESRPDLLERDLKELWRAQMLAAADE